MGVIDMSRSSPIRAAVIALGTAGLMAVAACEQQQSTAVATGPTSRPTPIPAGADGKVHLTDAQWKARLTPEQYNILRQKGTEQPFANAYDQTFTPGTYYCAACGQELFTSTQKFDSGCGWPAFSSAVNTLAVVEVPDADGSRTEVECSRCGGHLGHVFDDGPPPTHQRFCIDSAALKFVAATTQPTAAPSR